MNPTGRFNRILASIHAEIADKHFYEAEQMYKTHSVRLSNRKQPKAALDLLKDGVEEMVNAGQIASAIELCKIALSVVSTAQKNRDGGGDGDGGSSQDAVVISDAELHARIISLTDLIPGELPSADWKRMHDFISSAVKWSVDTRKHELSQQQNHHQPQHNHGKVHPDAKLCNCFGSVFVRNNDYPTASEYFVRGNDYEKFSKLLFDWALCGKKSELDLFLTRGILQILSFGNLFFSCRVYKRYVDHCSELLANHGPSNNGSSSAGFDTPLVTFCGILLDLVIAASGGDEAKNEAVYNDYMQLRSFYASSLSRDPSFSTYLNAIPHVFKFNPAAAPGAGMGNGEGDLLNMLMGNMMNMDFSGLM